MQTEATTSQAALTGSPRVSATTEKATAPASATAVQVSFSVSVIVLPPPDRVGFSPLLEKKARPGRKAPAPVVSPRRKRGPGTLLAAVEKRQNEDDDPVNDVAPVV